MAKQTLLVTGGAGYIGSHTTHQLVDAGYEVIVLDNLYSGHRWAIPGNVKFIEGRTGDPELVDEILQNHPVDGVIHFAAHIVVPESVSDPLKYYLNNTASSLNLIKACVKAGVPKFVFSSTAAVYGEPETIMITEDTPTRPINPYGMSKLMTEQMLADAAAAHPLHYVALRYFNVAGAQVRGHLGQATPEATHLIKVACESACGARAGMSIFGTDYDTPDGTCIRDYIHVDDLARAHLDALDYLQNGGESTTMNCGYGHGFSVREVIDTVKKVSGVNFPVTESGRRAGDPPALVADNSLIKETIGWEPRHDDLVLICRTAYQWERKWQQQQLAKTA